MLAGVRSTCGSSASSASAWTTYPTCMLRGQAAAVTGAARASPPGRPASTANRRRRPTTLAAGVDGCFHASPGRRSGGSGEGGRRKLGEENMNGGSLLLYLRLRLRGVRPMAVVTSSAHSARGVHLADVATREPSPIVGDRYRTRRTDFQSSATSREKGMPESNYTFWKALNGTLPPEHHHSDAVGLPSFENRSKGV